jgi:lipooligosaccharide transport system ATP-binding protein
LGEDLKVVEARGLGKKLADHVVLDDVNLDVNQGECFGILGPEGAGKSTLLRMLYGAASLHSGELFIVGLNARTNIKEIKARMGVLPHDEGLDADFTARENLQLFGSYHAIDPDVVIHRTEDLLKSMRLEELGDQFVNSLSSGMKRRLGIARAMINAPELLVLDEPTSGLDPQGRTWVWDFLQSVKKEKGTIFLTTHYTEEAEQICDRVALMDKGKILAVGEPKKLIYDRIGNHVVELQISNEEMQYYLARLNSNKFHYQVVRDHVNVHLRSMEDAQKVMGLVQNVRMTVRPSTLADVFLKLAGHDLRDEPL